MIVQTATFDDMSSWLALAAQVEHLFGPMVDNKLFHDALLKNIRRGSAFCIRKRDGKPGKPLLGGLLFSAHPPVYRIGWLAVSKEQRRRGVGRALVEHAFGLVVPPADMMVTTFDEKDPLGRDAVRFYKEMGFRMMDVASVRAPSGMECRVYSRAFK